MSIRQAIVFLADALLGFAGAVASGGLIVINASDSFVMAIAAFGSFFIVYQTICSRTMFTRARNAVRLTACLAIAAFCLTFAYRVRWMI